MLKGIIGSYNLSLLDRGSRCFRKKEVQVERMNTRTLAPYIYNAETPGEGSILFTKLWRDSWLGIYYNKVYTVRATLILHAAKISYEDGIRYSKERCQKFKFS